MKICLVVMAGGVGSRFWPESREHRPKQLLEIAAKGETLVQSTIARTASFASPKNTIIITSEGQRAELERQLPSIPSANVIAEPFGRNTAPCIALAASIAKERCGEDAVMVVLPADHVIRNAQEFSRLIDLGARLALETKNLITVGVHPTRAETGFGYIQLDDEHLPSHSELPNFTEFELRDVFRVKRFAEKPDIDTAKRFVESGDFLWNSGMFIWRVDSILAALAEHTPEIAEQIAKVPQPESPQFAEKLKEAYSCFRGVSIDYGVMEQASNVFVLRAGALGWSDVGSWDEVYRLNEKDLENNVLIGDRVVTRATRGSLVVSRTDQLIALYGVHDLVVVNTGDAILITTRHEAQGVRELVDLLKRNQMKEYL
jgi:mannose-1-phosphate guanylyltransferase